MNYAFAFWWGHDCAYAQPARMAADLYAHVPVCVIFIAGQPWWMESCVALLGPLVSLRAEAGHLHMRLEVEGQDRHWPPWACTHARTHVYILLLFMHVSTETFKKIFFLFSFSMLWCCHDNTTCDNHLHHVLLFGKFSLGSEWISDLCYRILDL